LYLTDFVLAFLGCLLPKAVFFEQEFKIWAFLEKKNGGYVYFNSESLLVFKKKKKKEEEVNLYHMVIQQCFDISK